MIYKLRETKKTKVISMFSKTGLWAADSYTELSINKPHTKSLWTLLKTNNQTNFTACTNRGLLLPANVSTLFAPESATKERNWKDEKNSG